MSLGQEFKDLSKCWAVIEKMIDDGATNLTYSVRTLRGGREVYKIIPYVEPPRHAPDYKPSPGDAASKVQAGAGADGAGADSPDGRCRIRDKRCSEPSSIPGLCLCQAIGRVGRDAAGEEPGGAG